MNIKHITWYNVTRHNASKTEVRLTALKLLPVGPEA